MWFSTVMRFALLYTARMAGRIIAVLKHGLFVNAALIALIAFGLSLHDRRAPVESAAGGRWLTATHVLALWALALIAWWVLQQRRRLLISKFEDLTEETPGARGLSVLLSSELMQLRDLFDETAADEVRGGRSARERLFEATADAPGSFLESAISTESALAIGPLKIPINVLLGLVNRLVQGPRLSGQMQNDGECRIVTVELVEPGRRKQWRVEDAAADGSPRPLAALARELALRMFADLSFHPPVPWTAAEALVEGLKHYRSTLHNRTGARLNLREAERRFLSALVEDDRFDLAYYNLGVVYLALGRQEAALHAFGRSERINPGRFGDHYALARVRYALAADLAADRPARDLNLRYSLDHCDRAIASARSTQQRAKALDLKALTQLETGDGFFRAAATSARAFHQAALALARAELAVGGRAGPARLDREQAAQLAAGSLRRLVFVSWKGAMQVRAAPPGLGPRWYVQWLSGTLERQALIGAKTATRLQPKDYDAWLDLGVVTSELRSTRRGIRILQRAATLAPTRGEAWCWLAVANARLFREDWVQIAYAKAIDAARDLPEPLFEKLAVAMRTLAAHTQGIRVLIVAVRRCRRSGSVRRQWVGIILGLRAQWLISGRRWRRMGPAGFMLATGLADADGWLKALKELMKARRAAAERAANFVELRRQVQALRTDPEDKSAVLQPLYDRAVQAGFDWEAADAAEALARTAAAEGRFDEAQDWWNRAIDTFERSHPLEVSRRGLRTELAKAKWRADRRSEALREAQAGVWVDPFSAYERKGLAHFHSRMSEWALARAEWEKALRTEPDTASTYHTIALCWYSESLQVEDRDRRRECLQRAAEALDRALALYEPDSPGQLDSRFLLGRIHEDRRDPEAAEAQWKSLEVMNYCPIHLGLKLAESRLRAVSFADAESRFRTIAAQLDKTLAADAKKVNELTGEEPGDGDSETYGVAAVWAHLGIALALARRYAAFPDALAQIEAARSDSAQLAEAAEKARWLGTCDRIEGEVRFHQGDLDGAAPLLELSLASSPAVESYYFLAATLLARLDTIPDEGAKRQTVARIRALAALSTQLDADGEYEERLAQLQARVEAI